MVVIFFPTLIQSRIISGDAECCHVYQSFVSAHFQKKEDLSLQTSRGKRFLSAQDSGLFLITHKEKLSLRTVPRNELCMSLRSWTLDDDKNFRKEILLFPVGSGCLWVKHIVFITLITSACVSRKRHWYSSITSPKYFFVSLTPTRTWEWMSVNPCGFYSRTLYAFYDRSLFFNVFFLLNLPQQCCKWQVSAAFSC